MKNLSTLAIIVKLREIIRKIQPYSLIIFIVLVAAIYGTVLLHTQNLSNQQPSEEAVSSQVQAAHVPHIDQKVVEQLNTLQDNSVSVKTLFDEARSNPFDQ